MSSDANEIAIIRAGIFLVLFCSLALWEFRRPHRKLTESKWRRWCRNLSLTIINSFLVRWLLLPMSLVAIAQFVRQQGWGVLSYVGHGAMVTVVSLILLDLVIYLQHVGFHSLGVFWRLHQVHHADMDFDVTTGARFHSLEILFSLAVKVLAIVALAPTPLAVLIFEVVLNGSAMFNHSNVSLPKNLDRRLRWGLVTPDMHRVHHSTRPSEAHSNFGFNLPWWDRLFGTYQSKWLPVTRTIGTQGLADPGSWAPLAMLKMPLKSDSSELYLKGISAACRRVTITFNIMIIIMFFYGLSRFMV